MFVVWNEQFTRFTIDFQQDIVVTNSMDCTENKIIAEPTKIVQ